jgi:hypothetical protein
MQMPPHDRRATLIVGAAMALLAVALAFIAWDALVVFTHALAEHRKVELLTGAAAAIVAAVQLALLTGVLFRGAAPGQSRLLRIVLWLSPLLVLLPLALLIATNATLPSSGYTRCGPSIGQRFLTVTWVPTGTACPPDAIR